MSRCGESSLNLWKEMLPGGLNYLARKTSGQLLWQEPHCSADLEARFDLFSKMREREAWPIQHLNDYGILPLHGMKEGSKADDKKPGGHGGTWLVTQGSDQSN